MGPSNVALVKLFQVDQQLREAQDRLDAATKNVRLQERRTNEAEEALRLAQLRHREKQAHAANLELDLKARESHIEKLRTQQQTARNNKEYQGFLIEISTHKVDRAKVEEQALKAMEEAEAAGAEVQTLTTQVEAERSKLATMRAEVGGKVAELTAEIEVIRPRRAEAAAVVPKRSLEAFDRLANHHDGEAMSSIIKPDRRREEYACGACMMDLVADIYNKLHTRDELTFCPSCRRILYIPADLPPEVAVKVKAPRPAPETAETSMP